MKPRPLPGLKEGLVQANLLQQFGVSSKDSLPAACPPRPRRMGRPRDTSLNSWKRHESGNKKAVPEKVQRGPDTVTDEAGFIATKTRRLSDLMHVT